MLYYGGMATVRHHIHQLPTKGASVPLSPLQAVSSEIEVVYQENH